MEGQMDESYYDEKKEFVCEGLVNAIENVQSSLNLIKAWRYSMPGLTNPEQIHEALRSAEITIRTARRNLEKARWASSRTKVEFDDWLRTGLGADLF